MCEREDIGVNIQEFLLKSTLLASKYEREKLSQPSLNMAVISRIGEGRQLGEKETCKQTQNDKTTQRTWLKNIFCRSVFLFSTRAGF